MIKISSAIFKTFFLSLCIVANTHFAFAQTASILPQGYTQYLDSNGKPLSAGKVYNYIPSTTTPKTTWQDAAETIPNANPVILDAAGRAKILGDGSYRQIVKDRNNVTIWDAVTSSTGSGSTSPTATGDGDLVGTIKPWAGLTAPNQYAFTYGQEVSRTTYSVLFTAITSSQSTFCSSGSPTLNGLSDTTNFWIGMSVEVSCVAAGFSTVVSKTSSTVTLAANANVTANVTAVFFPWGRGNGTTTFNLPDLRGITLAGNNNMGGVASSNLTTTYFGATNPNSIAAFGGNQSTTLLRTDLPNVSITPTFTGSASTGNTNSLRVTGASTNTGYNVGASITANTADAVTVATATITPLGTVSAIQLNGGVAQTLFSRIQPTVTTNYIIKITPDANSATASGVTALGGMTGSIACGTGLTCSGNTVTATGISSADAPVIPVIHPSSSNLVGTGCTISHQIWWVDQNLCSTADTWILNSSDPSALLSITIGGTFTNGDVVTLQFTFGAGACVVSCDAATTVIGGDTATTVAARLVTAVMANADLYNNVSGAQKQILRVSNTAGQIDFDFDSRVSMILTSTVSGAATETVTIPGSCAAACDNGWDINPTLVMGRLVTGLAPPPNSQMFAIIVQGGNSASPSAYSNQYGVFENTVLNSTVASISSRWSLLTPNTAGVINQGIFIGAGLHSPARTDKGNNTANFSELWTADVNSMSRSGSTWAFNASTNDKIQFLSDTYSVSINNSGVALDVTNSGGATIGRFGSAASSMGQIYLAGSTSGTAIITPQATSGSPTITIPNTSGTMATSATSPLALNATTGAVSCSTCATLDGSQTLTNKTISAASNTINLTGTSNSLGAGVTLTNSGTYYDGPSVAQGSSGTWLATGTVLIIPNAVGNLLTCKLWDGTTVISSGLDVVASISGHSMSLSGMLASPAANIRISCANQSANGGSIAASNGIDGNTASTLTAIRIN